MNIKHITEYAALGVASIGTSLMTGTKNAVETVSSGEILPTLDIITAPDTAQVSNIFNLVTQLTILIVTLWKALKKNKPTINEVK